MFCELIFEERPWGEILDSFSDHDFAHTFEYHRLSEVNNEGSPVLFVVFSSDLQPLACWPALGRRIPRSEHYDLTCVYGYAGPLFSPNVDCHSILVCFFDAMRAAGYVSFFSRMHPILVEAMPEGPLRGHSLGDIILIEVNDRFAIESTYRGSHRREIVNLRKSGMSTFVDLDCQSLPEFYDIYCNAMVDIGASASYFFSYDYFATMVQSLSFKVILIYSVIEGCRVSAAMFVKCGRFFHYHLSGTLKAYRKLAPSKLIIAQAHALAVDFGCDFFLLGGGVSSANDSLFKFKQGFSRYSKPFYVVKTVLDPLAYAGLCSERDVESTYSSFFPAYRK